MNSDGAAPARQRTDASEDSSEGIPQSAAKGKPAGKHYGFLMRSLKSHPNSPDLVGEVEINGRTYKLAAWIRVGHQGKYLDLVGSDIATGGLN